MTQEQIQNKVKEKAPQIEAMFSGAEPPIRVTKTGPGTLALTSSGHPFELTQEQVAGLEIYLGLITIFKPDDFQENKTSDTSPV